MNRVIYKQDNGTIAVIIPTNEALENQSLLDIAVKDVPTGKHFKICSDTEIPKDRTLRDSWTIDDSELTDGIGG